MLGVPNRLLKLINLWVVILIFVSCKEEADINYIVRVCVHDEKKLHIACLGTYVHIRWVLASGLCYPQVRDKNKLELFMEGQQMDCQHGQARNVADIVQSHDVILLRPKTPFSLSSRLSTVPLQLNARQKPENCVVFCNNRILKPTEKLCRATIEGHTFTPVGCSRKLVPPKKKSKCKLTQDVRDDPRDNNREKKCGSISERVTPCNVRHVKAAKSPVVCQGKLTGFVGDSANNPYKMKFKHIKHELEDIKKVLKLDCCL